MFNYGEVVVSGPSVVTVSSFGRQKLIENMMRVSVYASKQVIVGFLKEFCYSWGFRMTVTKFLAVANKCIKPSNVGSRRHSVILNMIGMLIITAEYLKVCTSMVMIHFGNQTVHRRCLQQEYK